MAEYVVRIGDTLSGIGAKNGVDWRQITGYRSGNPNLIFPGEVVRWGSPSPTPSPAPAPKAAPQPNEWEKQVQPLFGELTTFDQDSMNPIDIYNAALEKLGVSDARTRPTSLRQSLIDNQNLLDKLSGNITNRANNTTMTQAQRDKLYATEAAPIMQQGEQYNRQFSAAGADYENILGEAQTSTSIETEAQTARRSALMDRLKIAIDRTDNEEKKRQWQAEYDRQVALDKQNQANKDREFALAQQQAAKSGGGGGGGSRGGGGGGGSSANPMAEFKDYIAGQFKSAGKNPSRQTQDAWANAWFSSKGISNAARQVYWDAFNSTYNRPANPYDDWLYKR
jgi:hypothetical protein